MKHLTKRVQRIAKYIHNGYLSEHDKSVLADFNKSNPTFNSLISKILSNRFDLTKDSIQLDAMLKDSSFKVRFQRQHSKIGISISEQIRLLEKRELIINPEDKGFVEEVLNTISYYHLRGYFLPFEKEKKLLTDNQFKENTNFQQIYKLYTFDRGIKHLLFGAIQKIEIYLRTQFVLELCVNRSLGHVFTQYLENNKPVKLDQVQKETLANFIKNISNTDYKRIAAQLLQHKYLSTQADKDTLKSMIESESFRVYCGLSHPHLDKRNFIEPPELEDENDIKPLSHDDVVRNLTEELPKANEIFISHYYLHYSEPEHPPMWSAFEVLTIGKLSKWISLLKVENGVNLFPALEFKTTTLKSLVHTISELRNQIAHHHRLVYKNIPFFDKLPREPKQLSENLVPNSYRLFNLLMIIGHIITKIDKNDSWVQELINYLNQYDYEQLHLAGCPHDWEARLSCLVGISNEK